MIVSSKLSLKKDSSHVPTKGLPPPPSPSSSLHAVNEVTHKAIRNNGKTLIKNFFIFVRFAPTDSPNPACSYCNFNLSVDIKQKTWETVPLPDPQLEALALPDSAERTTQTSHAEYILPQDTSVPLQQVHRGVQVRIFVSTWASTAVSSLPESEKFARFPVSKNKRQVNAFS